MRTTLATACAFAILGLAGSGTAFAGPPDCPPASPNHGNPQPCGNPHDEGGEAKPCPPASPNAGKPRPCGKPGGGGGGGGGGPTAPEGNCDRADVVVIRNAKLVCLFLGANAQYATKAADCKDALLAIPVSPLVGVCVFLPPASD